MKVLGKRDGELTSMSEIESDALASAPRIASTGPIPTAESVPKAATSPKQHTHNGRLDGNNVVAHDAGEGLESVPRQRGLAHYDVGGGSVAAFRDRDQFQRFD